MNETHRADLQVRKRWYINFLHFAKEFSQTYSDNVFEEVIKQKRYQKKTISFLREILAGYGVENNLNKYLSPLSYYRHPTMEEINEAAYKS